VTDKVNLLDFDQEGLRAFFVDIGEKPFRARQLMQWVHQEGCTDFNLMTNLSKALREKLHRLAEVKYPEVISYHHSNDGTRKWLLKLDCGNAIETVYIPEATRGTLCVSSQVGCMLNCSFCSTAKQGFNRNLSTAEIISQVWLAVHALANDTEAEKLGHRVTNVVMMGMGEPLLNFDAVVKAMDLMMDDLAYGLSKRRVTLSTSGVVPDMWRLREVSEVSLAVSLHAPNDALRNELVPLNKKYPLKELMDVCRKFFDDKRVVTFEYVMLEGVNDTLKHADELIKLVSDVPCKVNLIPFNPFPMAEYKRSSDARIQAFRNKLIKKGINTITRKTRGEDIDAACGQLAGNFNDRTKRAERWQTLQFRKGVSTFDDSRL